MGPGAQEVLALAIVGLVVLAVIWRRWRRRANGQKASACGGCASAGPPPKEPTVRFYRRNPEAEPRERGGN